MPPARNLFYRSVNTIQLKLVALTLYFSSIFSRILVILHTCIGYCVYSIAQNIRWVNHHLSGKSSPTVKLNCWFCNEDVNILVENKNGWACPNCEQFNGFNQEGDYSQPLEGQYDVKDYKTKTICSPVGFQTAKSVLCDSCSQHQVLKVRQLAAFMPLNDESYNEEIDMYKDYLENVYNLCRNCQENVTKHLHDQDSKLQSTMKDAQRRMLETLKVKEHDGTSQTVDEPPRWRQRFPVLMLCLNAIAALTFFIVNLRLYAGSVSWINSAKKSTYISQGLSWLINTVPAHLALRGETIIVYTGAALCMLALTVAGKYSLYPEDAIHSLLWMVSIITTSDIFSKSLPWLHVTREISLCISVAILVVALICCARSRIPRHFTGYIVQKKSISQPSSREMYREKSSRKETGHTTRQTDAREEASSSAEISPLPREGSPQCENVRQDLESISLGLNKKSGSSSSVWSLPAIIGYSASQVTPDSSTDQQSRGQSRSVLTPSRLGFLTFDSRPPSRDSQSGSSRSPSPWDPVTSEVSTKESANNTNNVFPPFRNSAYFGQIQPSSQDFIKRAPLGKTPCVSSCGHPTVAPPMYAALFRNPSSPAQPMETLSNSLEENLGPCDSQSENASQANYPNIFNKPYDNMFVQRNMGVPTGSRMNENLIYDRQVLTAKEITALRQQALQSQHDTDMKGPRRSQRIALAGKFHKPWPLKKSLSCTNAYDKSNLEKAGASARTNKRGDFNASGRVPKDLDRHQTESSFSGQSVKVPHGYLKSGNANDRNRKELSRLNFHPRNDKHKQLICEFSDDELDDVASLNKKWPKRKVITANGQSNDFSWKWILVGLVIGTSITTNVFLACHNWLMQHDKS